MSEIATDIEASLQCTSQHLRLMKQLGILDSRRDGQTIYYFIVNNELTERCQLLLQIDKSLINLHMSEKTGHLTPDQRGSLVWRICLPGHTNIAILSEGNQ